MKKTYVIQVMTNGVWKAVCAEFTNVKMAAAVWRKFSRLGCNVRIV